jgi:hypothetical protein
MNRAVSSLIGNWFKKIPLLILETDISASRNTKEASKSAIIFNLHKGDGLEKIS